MVARQRCVRLSILAVEPRGEDDEQRSQADRDEHESPEQERQPVSRNGHHADSAEDRTGAGGGRGEQGDGAELLGVGPDRVVP